MCTLYIKGVYNKSIFGKRKGLFYFLEVHQLGPNFENFLPGLFS
jgi:hypothetical protein